VRLADPRLAMPYNPPSSPPADSINKLVVQKQLSPTTQQ
jgi:hypothetical protein